MRSGPPRRRELLSGSLLLGALLAVGLPAFPPAPISSWAVGFGKLPVRAGAKPLSLLLHHASCHHCHGRLVSSARSVRGSN